MGEKCELILDKDIYYPGETIHGRVECHFKSENTVKGISVSFRGRAKVYWKEGRYTTYLAKEMYFESVSELLLGETTFHPGVHTYPFSYNLPADLPSSMDATTGNIKYTILATVERAWGSSDECLQPFTVYSCYNFNTIEGLQTPMEFIQEKIPFSLSEESSRPINIYIKLPRNGYAPSESIVFSVKIKNESTIQVQEIRFRVVQGYEFLAENQRKRNDCMIGPESFITDSSVEPGNEISWNAKLEVPSDMFVGNLNRCNIINIFWELRGEVCLPFPHTNFTIHVPLILGGGPLA